MSVLSSTCLYTHAHTQEREREKKVVSVVFNLKKKNLEKIKKRPSFKYGKRGKKGGEIDSLFLLRLNKRRKERKNASNELFPLSRVRAFLFLSHELFRRSRERQKKREKHREKNISFDELITRTKTHPKLEHVVFDLDQDRPNRE